MLFRSLFFVRELHIIPQLAGQAEEEDADEVAADDGQQVAVEMCIRDRDERVYKGGWKL